MTTKKLQASETSAKRTRKTVSANVDNNTLHAQLEAQAPKELTPQAKFLLLVKEEERKQAKRIVSANIPAYMSDVWATLEGACKSKSRIYDTRFKSFSLSDEERIKACDEFCNEHREDKDFTRIALDGRTYVRYTHEYKSASDLAANLNSIYNFVDYRDGAQKRELLKQARAKMASMSLEQLMMINAM